MFESAATRLDEEAEALKLRIRKLEAKREEITHQIESCKREVEAFRISAARLRGEQQAASPVGMSAESDSAKSVRLTRVSPESLRNEVKELILQSGNRGVHYSDLHKVLQTGGLWTDTVEKFRNFIYNLKRVAGDEFNVVGGFVTVTNSDATAHADKPSIAPEETKEGEFGQL
jgi:hypothetical protein